MANGAIILELDMPGSPITIVVDMPIREVINK